MIPIALATAAIWYWAYGAQGFRPAADAGKTVAAPVVEKKVAAPAPAPAPVAAPAPAKSTILAGVPTATGLKYTLPGGASIDVLKDGVENKLIDFITGPSEVDKKTWFNFDRLSFETASTDLTASSKAQVEAIVAILKAYPAVKVKIGGYTDNQGDPQANMKLSDARAKRVADEIAKLGIAADRVEAEGYGEQFPVGDNATPEGRAKNRRTALSVRAK
jgi:outer membrane protein OmpA-like peptidoglycan-associated protein